MSRNAEALMNYVRQPGLSRAELCADLQWIAAQLAGSAELDVPLGSSALELPCPNGAGLDNRPLAQDGLGDDGLDDDGVLDPKREAVSDWIPATRRIGEALIGAGCGTPEKRLLAAAHAARAESATIPALIVVADEFEDAAAAIAAGKAVEGLDLVGGLLWPGRVRFEAVPLPGEDSLASIARLSDRVVRSLRRVEGASFLAGMDTGTALAAGLALGGGPSRATDLATATGQACRIQDASLLDAGQNLLALAANMEELLDTMQGPLTYCPGLPEGCKPGEITNCGMVGFFYTATGTRVDIEKLLVGFLKYLGSLNEDGSKLQELLGETLSPGGTKLLAGILTGVDKLRQRFKDKMQKFVGYDVYVVLAYDECVQTGDDAASVTTRRRNKSFKITPGRRFQADADSTVWDPIKIDRLRRLQEQEGQVKLDATTLALLKQIVAEGARVCRVLMKRAT